MLGFGLSVVAEFFCLKGYPVMTSLSNDVRRAVFTGTGGCFHWTCCQRNKHFNKSAISIEPAICKLGCAGQVV